MNNVDLLILDGPPAVGKSSIAKAIASELKNHETLHAVIEMDDLARIYPLSLIGIMYKNLAAIWPNYEALGNIKIIIPTFMQAGEREVVMKAAQAKRTTVCEVVVPYSEAARRIANREPNEMARRRLLKYLESYANNKTPDENVDFKVLNFNRSIEDVAKEIIKKLGWLTSL